MDPVPKWLTDMLIELERWEDEHPSVCACGATEARAICLTKLRQFVPPNLLSEARAVRDYLRQADRDKEPA